MKVSGASKPVLLRVLLVYTRLASPPKSVLAHTDFKTAHKIRNRASQIFQAVCEVPAHNRWCLTGTPIQNTLDDYGALLAFVGVQSLVTRDQFRFWITFPVLDHRGYALRTLRNLVRATCLRRTKAHQGLSETLRLPAKVERVEDINLAPGERELYDFFQRRSYLLANSAVEAAGLDPRAGGGVATKLPLAKRRRRQPAKEERSTGNGGKPRNTGNIVALISVLRMICDHGEALLPRAALEAWQKRDTSVVNWDMLETAARAGRRCCVCGRTEDVGGAEKPEGEVFELACEIHVMCEGCMTAASAVVGTPTCPKCSTGGADSPSMSPSPRSASVTDVVPSSKLSALLRNILATSKSLNSGPPVKRYVLFCLVLKAPPVY